MVVVVAQGMVASGLGSPHILENMKSLKSTVCWLKEENQTYKSKDMKVCTVTTYNSLIIHLDDNHYSNGETSAEPLLAHIV